MLITHDSRIDEDSVLRDNRIRTRVTMKEMKRKRMEVDVSSAETAVKVATTQIYLLVTQKKKATTGKGLLLLVDCLTSQKHASVSQGQICSGKFACCHTETEVADQTFYFTESQYTDAGPTSPSADPVTPCAFQVATGVPFLSHLYDSTLKNPHARAGIEPRIFRFRGGRRIY